MRKIVKLKDLCSFQEGYVNPPQGNPDYFDGEIKWIRAVDLNNSKVYSTTRTLTKQGFLSAKKSAILFKPGTIVISKSGTIGRLGLLQDYMCGNRATINIMPKEGRNVEYIFYNLLNRQTEIADLAVGSVQKNLYVSILENIDITLPSEKEQEDIVKILKSIDEKIENNRQINDNLEQQASSLLSDWISTYPCRTYKLSDIGKYVSDKCDTGDLTSQNYISTENMLPNKKGIVDASNIPTGKVTCFKVDDILIANIRPYFQKIWKADINGGCSTDVLCIRSCVESHSPILYWILHQDAFFEYVMTGAKGCKMPRGDKQHIMNWTIDLPESDYWADIATQLGAVDQRLAYNRIESNNLSNLRDTLLPKLMSGELKINELDC